MPETISEEITQLGLEPYALDLEIDGLTVVPPDGPLFRNGSHRPARGNAARKK